MNTAYFIQIFHGSLQTIALMICALALGFVLAVGLTLSKLSEYRLLVRFVDLFIFVMRGIPLLVLIFLIYYGSGQYAWFRESFLWLFFKEAFNCAVIALALNSSAYTAVIFLGAVDSVPSGEYEACKALGMSRALSLRRIILPHAWRLAIAAYSNEVVMICKGTSLASTITVLELTGVTREIISETYSSFEWFIIAGAIYLVINSILTLIFRYFEHRVRYAR